MYSLNVERRDKELYNYNYTKQGLAAFSNFTSIQLP